MKKFGKYLLESFVPVLLTLVGIISMTYYLNSRVEFIANRERIIEVVPEELAWSPGILEEEEEDYSKRDNLSPLENLILSARNKRKTDPNGALIILKQGLDKTGNLGKSRIYSEMGSFYAHQHDNEAANDSFEKAIEFNPESTTIRLKAALSAAREQKDYLLAERYIHEVFRIKPDFAPAFFVRGKIESLSNNLNGALRSYQAAIQRDPNLWEARYNMGLIYLNNLEKPEKASEIFAQLALNKPEKAEFQFNLGKAAYAQEKWDEAVSHYKKAIQLRKGDYDIAEVNLSLAYSKKKDFNQALKILDRLIHRNPLNATAHVNRGLILMKTKNNVGAKQSFLKAIEVKSNNSVAYFNLGKLSSDLGDKEESKKHYLKALEIEPTNYKAAINLGILYSNEKNPQAAAQMYKRAISSSPNSARAYFNLAVAEKDQGHSKEAVDAYRKALEIDPDYSEARTNLISLLSQTGEIDSAVSLLQDELDRDPSNISLRYKLVLLYKRKNDLQKARIELQRIIALDPHYKNASALLSGLSK